METLTINSDNSVDFNKKQTKRPFDDPITRQDVEKVISRAIGKNVKILNYHIRTYSEEKVGFMGAHRHLVVTIQRDNGVDKEIKTYFLKHVPYDVEQQAIFMEESKIFYKEVQFYKQIMPELMNGLKDKSWCAQCYLVKDDALLFEDLKSRNFTVKEKILDMTALKAAVTSLAKLHAASILAEKRMGTTFLQLYPEVLKECIFAKGSGFNEYLNTGLGVIIGVAKHLGLNSKNIPKVVDQIFKGLSTSKTRQNVVCHGDAWSYNLMFDNSKPIPTCVLVDFQLLRYVPATTDLLQLIYLTTRRQFREKNEMELLKYYYNIFSETLRENDTEVGIPTFDEVKEEYEELRAVGLVTATYYFPVNLVEGKLCAELTKDSDGFDSFMFRDRVELVLSIMRDDPNYRERISEIVTELVEKSEEILKL